MLHLYVHPDNPQDRLIEQAAARIRAGGVVVYPADSTYALGCRLGDKDAMERIHCYRLVTHPAAPISKYLRKQMNLRRITL